LVAKWYRNTLLPTGEEIDAEESLPTTLSDYGTMHEVENVQHTATTQGDIYENPFGNSVPSLRDFETIRSLRSLALRASKRGNHAEAERLLEEVLRLSTSKYGKVYSWKIETMEMLAKEFGLQGKLDKAANLFLALLQGSELAPSPEQDCHLRYALARIYYRVGRYIMRRGT
jgi:tetratricopeptide (TPR) repeat protein